MIDDAWPYALTVSNEAGAAHVLELIAAEMRVAMALTRCLRVPDINGRILVDGAPRG